MATTNALERNTVGKPWPIYLTRLMILEITYKTERCIDLRQENSIAENYIGHMMANVIDTSPQIHGATALAAGGDLFWSPDGAHGRKLAVVGGGQDPHEVTPHALYVGRADHPRPLLFELGVDPLDAPQ